MIENSYKKVVVVFLHKNFNSYLLQLRDFKTSVIYPGHWGAFGGAVEEGESPEVEPLKGTHFYEHHYDFMTKIQEIKGTNHVIKRNIMIYAEDPIVREVQLRHYRGIEEYTEKQTKVRRTFPNTHWSRAEISLNFLKELIADARKRHNLIATTQPNPLDAPDKVYCEVSK